MRVSTVPASGCQVLRESEEDRWRNFGEQERARVKTQRAPRPENRRQQRAKAVKQPEQGESKARRRLLGSGKLGSAEITDGLRSFRWAPFLFFILFYYFSFLNFGFSEFRFSIFPLVLSASRDALPDWPLNVGHEPQGFHEHASYRG
jgi:hypothetical protein